MNIYAETRTVLGQQASTNWGEASRDIPGKIMATFQNPVALAVAKAESGLNPRAVSATGDYGVFQINLKAHWGKIEGGSAQEKIEKLFDPEYNILLAKRIYDTSDFWPWTVYKTGAYKRHL